MTQAIVNPPGFKRCCRCKTLRPCGEYNKSRNRRDGLHPVCKPCRRLENAANSEQNKLRQRERYLANREQILAEMKAYRDANPEKMKARNARYYREHREEYLAKCRAYRQANRERIWASRRAFYAANPERHAEVRAYVAAYNRADRKANPEKYAEMARQRRAYKR